jgi:integrase
METISQKRTSDLSAFAMTLDEWDELLPMVRYFEAERALEEAAFDAGVIVKEGQHVNGPKVNMARRRFQKGTLFLRNGKRGKVWVARWLEDVIESGRVRRVYRSEVLGTTAEYPTAKLARRELQARLSTVNDPSYRARPTATFAEFAIRWKSSVLVQHKPSTQATMRSHVSKYLVPAFGATMLRDIRPESVQHFFSTLKVSPKTAPNIFVTLSLMFKSARAWRYVAHDPTEGVILPKRHKTRRLFFTVEEAQHILSTGDFCVWPKVGVRAIVIEAKPYRTFYWLAVETGLRAGELCGLRIDDLDLTDGLLHVRQSVWRGKVQSPKTENAHRVVELSPQLAAHLKVNVSKWRPNDKRLLFATRNGTPWDANLLVKRKLRPLLQSLGINGGGLHSFRHANAAMLDKLNVPLKVRQERLGHTDSRLTLDVYTHTDKADRRSAAVELGRILHPNSPKLQEKGPIHRDKEQARRKLLDIFGGEYDVSYEDLDDDQKAEVDAFNLSEMLTEALAVGENVDYREVSFILGRLSALQKPELIPIVTRNLERLYPVAEAIASFFKGFSDLDDATRREISSALLAPILDAHNLKPSEYYCMWVLNVFEHQREWNCSEELLKIFRETSSDGIRRFAALALATSGTRAQAVAVKEYPAAGSSLTRTALLLATCKLGKDERKYLRRGLNETMPNHKTTRNASGEKYPPFHPAPFSLVVFAIL